MIVSNFAAKTFEPLPDNVRDVYRIMSNWKDPTIVRPFFETSFHNRTYMRFVGMLERLMISGKGERVRLEAPHGFGKTVCIRNFALSVATKLSNDVVACVYHSSKTFGPFDFIIEQLGFDTRIPFTHTISEWVSYELKKRKLLLFLFVDDVRPEHTSTIEQLNAACDIDSVAIVVACTNDRVVDSNRFPTFGRISCSRPDDVSTARIVISARLDRLVLEEDARWSTFMFGSNVDATLHKRTATFNSNLVFEEDLVRLYRLRDDWVRNNRKILTRMGVLQTRFQRWTIPTNR